jgi:exodeoxyribonuclease-3
LAEIAVGTYNVNSVKSRLPALDRWLASRAVDVLCLQETKTRDDSFPEEFFRERGYRVVFGGMKAYNGVAIASRLPIEDFARGFAGLEEERPEESARLIRARIGDVNVFNAYVPQGKSLDHQDYAYKLRFLERLTLLLESLGGSGRPLLLAGDLNVAPTPMDVTKPETKEDHVCFHRDVRRAFEDLLSLGLEDLFRKHRPGGGEYSFFDYRVPDALQRNIGWRIDHLLGTPPLAEACGDAFAERELRGWDRPSDHVPLVALFDGAKGGFLR